MQSEIIKKRQNRDLSCNDLYSIDQLSINDIDLILELAEIFKKHEKSPMNLLSGKTFFNVFFENSTRTRSSFELAAKQLGANVINIEGSKSSSKKGESFIDTIQTVNALSADGIIVRASESGLQRYLSAYSKAPIINAGDGILEHPSQALLDTLTIKQEFGKIKDIKILIVGDVLHSRVFGSLYRILTKMNAKIEICAPSTFIPKGLDLIYHTDLKKAAKDKDVIYTLRVQSERGSNGFVPDLKDYSKRYLITQDLLPKTAILMHPGPVIRNTDIAYDAVDSAQSRILNQVQNGLATRKAILYLLSTKNEKHSH
ncbi:MAG: aspartate carbamoyltransferase catalytic subunit [Candidatus Gracilibacteria bacterium]|nr:aspartate carbamoyltransferase catalytic subunit [Candidatus Gracilibacteria bacterium]